MRILFLAGVPALIFGQAAAPKPPSPAPSKPAAAKPAAAKPATSKPPAAPAVAANDPVVFRVGGETMTRSQFDRFLSLLPPEVMQQTQGPGGKRQIAERFAEMKALAQAARKQKLNERPDVKQQLAVSEDQVLASSLYQSLAKSAKPAEADTRKYYEEHKTEFEQAKARHILIRFQGSRVPLKPGQKDLTEAESLTKTQELKAKLVAGADFATLAKAESDDSGSGANGGDLGSFGRGRMVPQFDEVVFSLPPGEISEPTKTPFGYHLIQVQERTAKTYDQARGEIEQKLGPAEAQRLVNQVRKEANVMLDETYFPVK